MLRTSIRVTLGLTATLAGCSADPGATGTAKFTTWGEEYIEQGIFADPTDEAGFVDGWSVRFDKFLVHFAGIGVSDAAGDVGATMEGSRFVDNVEPGEKDLVTFPDLEAKAWDRIEYQIVPAQASAQVVAGDPADLARMVDEGWSIYVEGSASKAGGEVKTFHWGFKTATRYSECRVESGGKSTEGIVVTSGGTDVSQLTTHGDHLFYDRLQASPDPGARTSLRFEAMAAADAAPAGNGDGEISLEELSKAKLDVTKYDPSGLDVQDLGAFIAALARTIGHFRGEGECRVSQP